MCEYLGETNYSLSQNLKNNNTKLSSMNCSILQNIQVGVPALLFHKWTVLARYRMVGFSFAYGVETLVFSSGT